MVHVLKFDPIYKELIWGGRHFEDLFGRSLPTGVKIGESWDLVDLPDDTSRVAEGPSAGRRLDQLVREWGRSLLGSAALEDGRFPLLVKFLDANADLSVQVHPNHAQAAAMGGGVRAKYELWYVISSRGEASIYRGFKEGVTGEQVVRALATDDLADLLVKLPAKPGDWFYLPGGTVHALEAGLIVAEIQNPSDTTFRLYDWGRVDGKTGRPRDLHIDQALSCLDFGSHAPPPAGRAGETFDGDLLEAPTFRLSKRYRTAGSAGPLTVEEPMAWVILRGSGSVGNDVWRVEFNRGDVLLIPAGLKDADYAILDTCSYLEATLRGSS